MCLLCSRVGGSSRRPIWSRFTWTTAGDKHRGEAVITRHDADTRKVLNPTVLNALAHHASQARDDALQQAGHSRQASAHQAHTCCSCSAGKGVNKYSSPRAGSTARTMPSPRQGC